MVNEKEESQTIVNSESFKQQLKKVSNDCFLNLQSWMKELPQYFIYEMGFQHAKLLEEIDELFKNNKDK